MKKIKSVLMETKVYYSKLPVPKTNPYIRSPKKWFFWKRLDVVLELIYKHVYRRDTALDFGTGTGNILPALSILFDQVYGIDIDERFLKIASKLLGYFDHTANVKLIKVEIEKELECFNENSIDCILALDVLEHVPHFREILSKFKKILTNNGTIILSLQCEHLLYKIFSSEKSKIHHVVSNSDLLNEINRSFTIVDERNLIFFNIMVIKARADNYAF